MSDEDFDDYMDNLSQGKRNAVLGGLGVLEVKPKGKGIFRSLWRGFWFAADWSFKTGVIIIGRILVFIGKILITAGEELQKIIGKL